VTPSEYVKAAIRTESPQTFAVNPRILHGVIGISTEAGEMLSNLKKALFYGNEVDINNLKEEIGDVLWYIAILSNELDISIETLMEQNIRKLQARYPEKFSKDASDNRDYRQEAEAAGL